MSEYAKISNARKFRRILTKLKNKFGIELSGGGKHPIKVTSIHTNESYPIPSSHREINVHIIKDFISWLERNDVCTKNEFDQLL